MNAVVFGASLGIALLFSMGEFFWGGHVPNWAFVFLIAVFDTPHVLAGLWVILAARKPEALKGKVLLFTLLWPASGMLCYFFDYGDEFFVFHSHFALWHFVKQNQAWFHITLPKEPQGKLARVVNHWGIFSATWGFVLWSLCRTDAVGWYLPNDIVTLPEALRPMAMFVCLAGIFAYAVYHVREALRGSPVPMTAHLVFLTALFTWGARLTPFAYLQSCLVVIPHSLTYFYLLNDYSRRKSGHRMNGPQVFWLVTFVALFSQLLRFRGELMGGPSEESEAFLLFILGLSLSHYFNDKLFWNSTHNPGWRN